MLLFAESMDIATNPMLGVLIFLLGGLAGALFYLPFKKVKNWAWESYWLIFAVFALIVVPWVLAICFSPNAIAVLKAAPTNELGYCFLCGAMWGVGGLTWGLMIRYLGVGLGLALGCGICSAAGSLIPPVINGTFVELLRDSAGRANYGGLVSLGGVLVSVIGILFVGGAGMRKEKELSDKLKKVAVAEYNFKLGVFLAIFSGLTSAAMNFGLQGGETVGALACPFFTPSQFKESSIPDFTAQLKEAKPDTVSGFLYQQFTPETKNLFTTFSDKKGERSKMQDALSKELNRIIQAGSIFQAERFAGVKLSDEARTLALAKQTATASTRLNRYLLEKALPMVIKVQSPQPAVIDQAVTAPMWRGVPILVVVLLGGFVVNCLWCLFLNVKNKTTGDYVNSALPLLTNFFFAGLAGVIWCMQMVSLKTGEPVMGPMKYIGWSVMFSGAILFGTVFGVLLGEWRSTSARTRRLLTLGLVFLVASSVISGYSGYLSQ